MLLLVVIICLFPPSLQIDKQCLFHMGSCVDYCPRNMHPYHTRCTLDTMSQRTCNSPHVYNLGFTCGWSRCDCNSDLVLDESDGSCIKAEKCVPRTRKAKRPLKIGDRYKKSFKIPKGVELCPENTVDFVDSKCRPTPSQRSCNEPAGPSLGVICDWSRCDSDYPLVIHLPSGYCIMYEECTSLDNKWYTGHCPMLKFRFGKGYGDNTRQILREIRSKGLFNKPLEYRRGDHYELANMPRRERPTRDAYDGLHNREPVYMTGYTGYVPGMNFRYGKSYSRSADDCMADFTEHQRDLRRKADMNKSYARSRSAPKMETIHSRDEIRRDLHKFREINKYKENTISPEFPPIAGYTGHIPRIKGSEASLSQRYHCAARRGLELIRLERDKRQEHQVADTTIKSILKTPDKRCSYLNWG